MQEFAVGLFSVGIFVLITGFLSVPIERIWLLSRPVIFLLTGIILGPHGLRILNPEYWSSTPDKILLSATELTMGIALMAVALRIPPDFFSKNKRSMAIILGLGMTSMWLITAIIMKYVTDMRWIVALLIAAVVTPTDPVLSTTIVHGKIASEHIPEKLRNLISAEAGANDGLALPFVYLPMLIYIHGHDEGLYEWFTKSWLLETFGALVLGYFAGKLTGKLLQYSEKKRMMENSSFLSTTLALTFMILGLSELLNVNGILAVFIAGLSFDQVMNSEDRAKEEKTQEAINQFFTSPLFLLFGVYAPISEWLKLGMTGLTIVTGILLFRRLPFWLLMGRFIPIMNNFKDRLIAGWFGPIGAAALYYALEAKSKTSLNEVWVISSLVIFSSILIHGMTASPLSKLLGTKKAN